MYNVVYRKEIIENLTAFDTLNKSSYKRYYNNGVKLRLKLKTLLPLNIFIQSRLEVQTQNIMKAWCLYQMVTQNAVRKRGGKNYLF